MGLNKILFPAQEFDLTIFGFVHTVLFVAAFYRLLRAIQPLAYHRVACSWQRNALLCLSTCCLLAFLSAAFGDAWEPVKHQYLFNLLIDACLIWATLAAARAILMSQAFSERSRKPQLS